MSLSVASFVSKSSPLLLPTVAPKTRDCLFMRIGDGGALYSVDPFGESGGDGCLARPMGSTEDTDRRPKPKRFPGFGGKGGG